MKPSRAPLPGEGNPKNLVNMGDHQTCPCCGALWKGGRPWAEKTLTSQEAADILGVTRSAVVQRLSKGTLAGYQGPSNEWIVPVFVVKPISST